MIDHNLCKACGQGKIRKTGLFKAEEEVLLLFCLSDDYPREVTLPRTGTRYVLRGESEAHLLWRRLKGKKPAFRKAYDESGEVFQEVKKILW